MEIKTASVEIVRVTRPVLGSRKHLWLACRDADSDNACVLLTPAEAYQLAAALTQVASDIVREGEA